MTESQPAKFEDKPIGCAVAISIASDAKAAVEWFADVTRRALADNLQNLTLYGPAVTPIYDGQKHRIHHLIVVERRDVDQLLVLAKHSSAAATRRITPPLIMTGDALQQSHDVFPLEWLDISQFSATIIGEPLFSERAVNKATLRLQCERELRSLDFQLQRGILASGGKVDRIERLEDEAADSLIRVLRGISWLSGDHERFLPDKLLARSESITKVQLTGCREAIRVDGKHDIATVSRMIEEIGQLSNWIDAHQVVRE